MNIDNDKVTIPLGAKVRVLREDSSVDSFTFLGTDADGPIFEDASGTRVKELGVYTGIAIDAPAGK